MFGQPRVLFNYISLHRPHGAKVYILADFVYKMEEAVGEGVKVVEEDEGGVKVKKEVKEKVRVTNVVSPFGDSTIVLETPEQIAQQLQAAAIDAIKQMQQQIQSQVLQVPAGAVSVKRNGR